MSSLSTKINPAQKTMMNDFHDQYKSMLEEYWNPNASDEYWDKLTEAAMNLIEQFQTDDTVLNQFMQSIVVAFMNSREEMLS